MSSQSMIWEQEFQARLDEDARKRAAAHAEALQAATAEHERIREVAEAVRQQAELQAELERQRQREKEQAELEKMRRQVLEAERRAEQEARDRRRRDEELARQEEERKRAAAAEQAEQQRAMRERQEKAAEWQRQQDAAAEKAAEEERSRREADEKAKKAAALESVKRAQEARNQANKAQAPPSSSFPPSAAAPAAAAMPSMTNGANSASVPQQKEQDEAHARYVAIHRNMKELRKWLLDYAKEPQNKALKTAMGDSRREIRKLIGQLTGDAQKNGQTRERLVQVLLRASEFAQPTVEIGKFLYGPPPSSPQTQVPALLIYEMNIFIKALMGQFVGEGSLKASMSNPLGILGSAVLANSRLQWEGRPLTDMLLAKFHVVCPLLFGIYGSEQTDEGKRRIGWRLQKDAFGGGNGHSGSWITPLEHADRMTGLGAGFAALTLRNYERSRSNNPFPPWHFWRAVAAVTNVPAEHIQSSHAFVLRAMLADNERRILDAFGDFGVLLMKYALVSFPAKAPRNLPVVQRLGLMAEQLAKEKKLYLQ